MASLHVADIADLVTSTLADLGRMKWTEAATDLQEYVAFGSLINKGRVTFGSGSSVTWNVRLGQNTAGNARHAGMFEVDNINVGEGLKTANAPWRHATSGWAFDRREPSMNKSPAMIVDLIKERRVEAMVEMAEEVEDKFWAAASGTTTDAPLGINTWLVRNATTGFTGGNHANFSGGLGGISSTTFPRWANWSAAYTTIGSAAGIALWREAFVKTRFKSPVAVSQYNTGDKYSFYCGYDELAELESYQLGQNESIGTDLAAMDGNVLFRKIPVVWVPAVDSDSGNPIYGINWGVFKVAILNGWNLKETGPFQHGLQHNTLQTHVDLTYQIICYDRRRTFILYTT